MRTKMSQIVKEVKKDRDDFVADLRKDFAQARTSITEEKDRVKFDAVEREVIGGWNRAFDSLIELAPILDKYGI